MKIGARNQHIPGFQRLAQAVEDIDRKFREFIEKQDTVMGEGGLAGPRFYPAANHGRHRCGMMGRAERSYPRQSAIF